MFHPSELERAPVRFRNAQSVRLARREEQGLTGSLVGSFLAKLDVVDLSG